MNLRSQFETGFPSDVRRLVETVARAAGERKARLVLVGGGVRDLLLNRPVRDVDFMTDHPSSSLARDLTGRLNAHLRSHPRFLTHVLRLEGNVNVDLVTARTERYKRPGALPEVFPARIEEDFSRRDFSINAMAAWLAGGPVGDLLDPLGGKADLEAGRIRVLHNQSFRDDPTRILRAARYAGRFGFQLESETERRLAEAVSEGLIEDLSPTRRRHELELIFDEENPRAALDRLVEWDALARLHPSFSAPLAGAFNGEGNGTDKRIDKLARFLTPLGEADAAAVLSDLEFSRADKAAVKDLVGRR